MDQITKSQRRHLRDLAAVAHDRELSAALERVLAHFQKWQAAEITAWDLNERIHEYHDGVSREIYRRYSGPHLEITIARALADGLLAWEEVRADCRPLLEPMTEYWRDARGDSQIEAKRTPQK